MHISTKCSIAIHCLVFIYEYGEKAKVTSELLSRSSGINPVTIRNILSSLKKSGIILVRRSGTICEKVWRALRSKTLFLIISR